MHWLLYPVVFVGGILTILGPCILPILPIVFARSDRSLRSDGAPMLAGLAVTFAIVATAATATASWVSRANEIGRWAAMVLLAGLGATLMFPAFAAAVSRPAVWLGRRLDASAVASPRVRPFIVGSAIGLVWAPCAGPILGLVVATAVAAGGGVSAAPLFLTYALGAAASLAVVLTAGGRLLAQIRRTQRADRWVRPALGALTLASVLVLGSGWDRALYARVGDGASGAEAGLLRRITGSINGGAEARASVMGESIEEFVRKTTSPPLPDEGMMPDLAGAAAWINSAPLTREALRGKVVMVDFWTFGCYNCLNALPHVEALEAKYRDRGLVVIGVHTPEFAHEKILGNVRREVSRLGVVYPVAVDNDYRIWSAFDNQYWPAAYFIDRAGHVRYHHFGEGRYDEQDAVVARLLAEAPPPSPAITADTARSAR
jgi:cytochrome c biogenesis protein CcdA/thiol-disulfide isomerase/thioredoxin